MFGVTRWNPFENELFTLHREMDRLFNQVTGAESSRTLPGVFTPQIEVLSEKDAWRVRLALPGIDPKNVDINMTGNTLTISGERVPPEKTEEKSTLSEIRYGRFERSLTLPQAIEVDKVSASYRDGMLELTLPLKESVKPRRIEIATDGQQATRKEVAGVAA